MVSSEESIYKMFEKKSLQEEESRNPCHLKKKQDQFYKINLLKQNDLKSTGKAIVSQEHYHLISKENLTSSFSNAKKNHSTFGIPQNDKKSPLEGPKSPLGAQTRNHASLPKQTKNVHKQIKPVIPKFEDCPLMGLSSNVGGRVVYAKQ